MISKQEEKDSKQLKVLAKRLHVPVPEAFWMLEVFDKDGKLIQEHRQRSHSWTRNAYNSIFSHLACKNVSDVTFEAGKLSLKDTGAAIRSGNMVVHRADVSGDATSADFGTLTPATNINKGILVGSGVNAESFEDFVLQTPITEGVGAGQLNAIASNNHVITYVPLTLKDEQVRYFNNNSGGNVDINEVCIADGISVLNTASHYDCVMSRDHLGATVTVPDTGQVKVTYTIQLTYPA